MLLSPLGRGASLGAVLPSAALGDRVGVLALEPRMCRHVTTTCPHQRDPGLHQGEEELVLVLVEEVRAHKDRGPCP